MRKDETINIRVDPTDIVEIETQYDKRRSTVLYVHVNGETVLRIQGLSKESQLNSNHNPIEMKADNRMKFFVGERSETNIEGSPLKHSK